MEILSLNISDIAVITVKNVDCCCIVHDSSRSESINVSKNFVLEKWAYIKNIALISSLIKTVIFCLFCFSIYKMADSEYSKNNNKSSKISIGTVMKNPEMLKIIPGHLEKKNNILTCN